MATEEIEIKTERVEVENDVYPVNREAMGNMGRCLIINNIDFEGHHQNKRTGAEKDSVRLQGIFGNLMFDVTSLENQTSAQMLDAIQEHAKQEDNKIRSAFVLIIMSHGDRGYVCGTSGNLEYQTIISSLNNQNCPELAGKPKLCFFQACKGDKMPPLIRADSMQGEGETYPLASDMLMSFAAQGGYKTYRTEDGGFYINCVAKALVNHAFSRDVLEILQIVEKDIRRILNQCSGKEVCMSTAVKLLGWERKFYFYPQGKAIHIERRPLPAQEQKFYDEYPRRSSDASTSVLYVVGGSKPQPEVLYEGRTIWTVGRSSGLKQSSYCQAISSQDDFIYIASESGIYEWIPEDSKWETIKKFNSTRTLYGHAMIGGKVYILGGEIAGRVNNHFWAYNTQNEKWEAKPDMRCDCSGKTAVVIYDHIYITCGTKDVPDAKLDVFNPESQKWATINASMNVPRCWHATATCGRYLWVFGGLKGSAQHSVCADVERYDIALVRWEKKTSMLTPRSHLSVTFFGGKFYATGGKDRQGKELKVVEIYDPERDVWTSGPALNLARSLHNSIVVQKPAGSKRLM